MKQLLNAALAFLAIAIAACTSSPKSDNKKNDELKKLAESASKQNLIVDTIAYRYSSDKNHTYAVANVMIRENLCDSIVIANPVSFAHAYISIPGNKVFKEGYYTLKFTSDNNRRISSIIFENLSKSNVVTFSDWKNELPNGSTVQLKSWTGSFTIGKYHVTIDVTTGTVGTDDCTSITISITYVENGITITESKSATKCG